MVAHPSTPRLTPSLLPLAGRDDDGGCCGCGRRARPQSSTMPQGRPFPSCYVQLVLLVWLLLFNCFVFMGSTRLVSSLNLVCVCVCVLQSSLASTSIPRRIATSPIEAPSLVPALPPPGFRLGRPPTPAPRLYVFLLSYERICCSVFFYGICLFAVLLLKERLHLLFCIACSLCFNSFFKKKKLRDHFMACSWSCSCVQSWVDW